MHNAIRKISVGLSGDFDKMMHYQVGKRYRLSNVEYILTDILIDRDLLEKDKLAYNIYIADKNSKVLWKTITDIPCIIEYNINFE